MSSPVIQTSGLTKRFGTTTALDHVSLGVAAGEVFALLGPNGAGKTTLLRLLLDLLRPTSGSATVCGWSCRTQSLEVRRRVAYLPGDLRLPPRWTGREVLDHLAALRGDKDPAVVDRLSKDLDVDLGRRVGELSKGNRQKVGLLAAFMGRPEVMVLDEPTSGLDPVVQQTFHALVDEAVAEGSTVLLSSHVLAEVQRMAHRAAILRAGRVVDVVGVGVLADRISRTIELRFSVPVPIAELSAIPGVSDLEVEAAGTVVRCRVSGSVDALLKAAARHTVESITSREPDLEDLFMELVR